MVRPTPRPRLRGTLDQADAGQYQVAATLTPADTDQPAAACLEARWPGQSRRPAAAAAGAWRTGGLRQPTLVSRTFRCRRAPGNCRWTRSIWPACMSRACTLQASQPAPATASTAATASFHRRTAALMETFATELLAWFDRHGRQDLPWQHPRDAYRVWLSEVMLQQTQVATVIAYFQRFVDALPTLPALAAARRGRRPGAVVGPGLLPARAIPASGRTLVRGATRRRPAARLRFAARPARHRPLHRRRDPGPGARPALRHPGRQRQARADALSRHPRPSGPERAVEKQLWRHAEAHTPDSAPAPTTPRRSWTWAPPSASRTRAALRCLPAGRRLRGAGAKD